MRCGVIAGIVQRVTNVANCGEQVIAGIQLEQNLIIRGLVIPELRVSDAGIIPDRTVERVVTRTAQAPSRMPPRRLPR